MQASSSRVRQPLADIRCLAEHVEESGPRAVGTIALWRAPESLQYVPLEDILRSDLVDEGDRAAVALRRSRSAAERLARRRLFRRLAIATHVGCHSADIKLRVKCATCASPTHGQPLVTWPAGLSISTAAFEDGCVVAIGKRPLGVDMEHTSKAARLARAAHRTHFPLWEFIQSTFAPTGCPAHVWTAMEAISKGTGAGLMVTPDKLHGEVGTWTVEWLSPEPGLLVALASQRGPETSRGLDQYLMGRLATPR